MISYSGIVIHRSTQALSSVTAVLVSRFLIDLQEANRSAIGQASFADVASMPQAAVTLHFARSLVNSFGASIAISVEPSELDRHDFEATGADEADGSSSRSHNSRDECDSDVVTTTCP